MKNIFNLTGKVAIVTGGYGHLGYEMAMALAESGAKVYVAGKDKAKFEKRFDNKIDVNFVELDISSIDSIKRAYEEIVKKEEQIDILVNNAAYSATNNPEIMSSSEWETGIDGSLNSVFRCIIEVIPFMKENGGKIVNISSMYGVVVPDLSIYEGREQYLNPPNYGTAKAGVIHLTKYYASFLAKYKINVNAISPGPFPSSEIEKDLVFKERLISKVPLKRIGVPADLRGILLLLVSSASDYITGQNICVDGGWTL